MVMLTPFSLEFPAIQIQNDINTKSLHFNETFYSKYMFLWFSSYILLSVTFSYAVYKKVKR